MKVVQTNRDESTDKSDDEGSSGSEESDEGGDANYDPSPAKRGKSGNAGAKKKSKGGKGSSSEEEEDEKGSESESDKEAKKKAAAGQSSKPAPGKKNSGYTREYKLSAALADVVGAKQMARHEVVKKMWAVIKERDLRDPKDKRFTVCDPQLEKVFGIKRFNTFAMMKYLKNHFSEL